MTDPTDLDARLGAMLRAKAGQVTIDEREPFDRTRVVVDPMVLDPEPMPHRSRRLVLALAVAAVTVLVVGVAVVAVDRDHRSTTVTGTPDDGTGRLVPTWVPDTYQLWDTTRSPVAPAALRSGATQLFGIDGVPSALVQVGREGADWGVSPVGPSVGTVHGAPATVALKHDPEVPGLTFDSSDAASEIDWKEAGHDVRAIFTDLDPAAGVRALDAATWRVSGDPTSGLEPSSLAAMALLDEDVTGTGGPSATTSFVYAPDPAATSDRRLLVETSIGMPAGAYLLAWLSGHRRPDGSTQVFRAPSPETGQLDNAVTVTWRDGTQVSARGGDLDEATLARVARSEVPVTAADLDGMAAEVTDRLEALPVVSAVELSGLRLELRGTDGRPGVLCSRAPSSSVPVCGRALVTLPGELDDLGLVASVAVGGAWYVTGASPRALYAPPLGQASQPAPGGAPSLTALSSIPTRQVEQDGWHFLVATMPADLDAVSVTFDGTGTPACQDPQTPELRCGIGVDAVRPVR